MKIVLIGAGSFVFAPSVLHDAIIDPRLAEHAIAIDPAITDKLAARQALTEILQAHADILLQFH